MKHKTIQLLTLALFFGLVIWGSACKSDYTKLVERELASGVKNDSIFMGFYMGMPRNEFYKHCLDLNHAGKITNGPENSSVLYSFPEGYKFAVDMNFYPEFKDEKIWKMGTVFNYQSWAPWNKQCFSDQLMPDVLLILEKWYGTGFLALKNPEGKPFYVKVDGNRQILVYTQNERNVRADITDLTNTPDEQKPKQDYFFFRKNK